jgi:tRNA nucleotidyltransferase (CCA-adding enzyme)
VSSSDGTELPFEYLDHPADIGFRAYGRSLPGLFESCAHALVSLILDASHIDPLEQIVITAEGIDQESLLVNFLNEVLYYIDGKRLAFARFTVSTLDENYINCIALGEPRDRERHPGKLIVKAVTYHQLRLARQDDHYIAEVYVDI